jgi:hypothetical protein
VTNRSSENWQVKHGARATKRLSSARIGYPHIWGVAFILYWILYGALATMAPGLPARGRHSFGATDTTGFPEVARARLSHGAPTTQARRESDKHFGAGTTPFWREGDFYWRVGDA